VGWQLKVFDLNNLDGGEKSQPGELILQKVKKKKSPIIIPKNVPLKERSIDAFQQRFGSSQR